MLQGAQLQARLEMDAAAHASWLAQVRDGVHQMLRSRIASRQRHGALQLAAAMTGLAGSGWLLGSSKVCCIACVTKLLHPVQQLAQFVHAIVPSGRLR